ncbi:MAG: DMT family transporter [Pseudomonadota bacterium]
MVRIFLFVFGAMTCIVLGDVAGKTLTGQGVAPAFVAWTRFAFAAVVLLPFAGLQRAELARLGDWRLWLRAAFVCAAIASILTGLRTVPLADAFGAFFVGPIVAYILSVLCLKERPQLARIVLLAVGFVGVLMVVRPGLDTTPGIGFAVMAGVLYGAYLTATRWLAPQTRPRFLLISQLLIGSVLLAPLGLSVPVPPMTLEITLLIAASALASAAGNFLLVTISRTTPASVISPLIYTQLIAAIGAGYVFFGDLPDLLALAGLALILLSGLASLRLART